MLRSRYLSTNSNINLVSDYLPLNLTQKYNRSSYPPFLVMLDSEIGISYEDKTQTSKRLFHKATKVFAGGINHNIRFFKPYPFFSKWAKGKNLCDVDDNEYTDYWMGHWSLILGHSPPTVVNALSQQLRNGTLYGTANDVSLDLGELIQKHMPGAENLRFSSTGSEATMYAVRLARAKSHKRVIAKIIGGWHGFNTTLMKSVNYPFHDQEGAGLVAEEEQFVESLPFNDLDSSIKILESAIDDLACIILEPILGGAGCVTPDLGYLKGLQEFAQKNDILLILDEIVTGFRLSMGGASQKYNLKPDLFTLGKIVGGGMPIGIVCGKKEVMSLADPGLIKENQARCNIGGGTYSCNPMTMAAGLATINYLNKNRDEIYQKINELGAKARTGLAKIFREAKIDVEVTGEGSLFLTHFLNNKVRSIRNATDAAMSDLGLLYRYHMGLIASHQIFFLPLKMGAISSVHTDIDIAHLLEGTRLLVNSGILTSEKAS
jgi:glutamate-1-semialdehyde 2,1-aminomutase